MISLTNHDASEVAVRSQTFVASFKVAKTSAQQSSQHFQPFRQIHSSRREQPYNSLHDHLQRIAHQHVQLM